METKRAKRSVGFFSYCMGERGFAPILITAVASLVALLAVAGWQIEKSLRDKSIATSYIATPAAEPSDSADSEIPTDFLSDSSGTEAGSTVLGSAVLDGLIAKYVSLQEQGLYTPDWQKAISR